MDLLNNRNKARELQTNDNDRNEEVLIKLNQDKVNIHHINDSYSTLKKEPWFSSVL